MRSELLLCLIGVSLLSGCTNAGYLDCGGFGYCGNTQPQFGFDGPVSTMALATNGDVLVGGQFTHYGNQNVPSNFVSLNQEQYVSYDNFAPIPLNSGNGFGGRVLAIKAVGSTIYVGGEFVTYRAQTANHFVRLDAASGAIQFPNESTDARVTQISADSISGDVYVTGDFTQYDDGTVHTAHVLRFASGVLDTSYSASVPVPTRLKALSSSGGTVFYDGTVLSHYDNTGSIQPSPISVSPVNALEEFQGEAIRAATGLFVYQLSGFFNLDGTNTGNLSMIASDPISQLATSPDGTMLFFFTSDGRFGRIGSGFSVDYISPTPVFPTGTVSCLLSANWGGNVRVLVGGSFNSYLGNPIPPSFAVLDISGNLVSPRLY